MSSSSATWCIPLVPSVQEYPWGRYGMESAVSRLCHHQPILRFNETGVEEVVDRWESDQVRSDTPYAELWMGTHPNGPSRIAREDGSRMDLGHFLRQCGEDFVPENLQRQYPECFEHGDAAWSLPFLFKILSVRTALSIQAHPDRGLASQLHAKFPNIYKDPNHKPEMAIALTPFTALCSFRPLPEIAEFLTRFPFLNCVFGADECLAVFDLGRQGAGEESEVIRGIFTHLLRCDEAIISETVQHLRNLLSESSERIVQLAVELANEFGDHDCGVLCVFLLNYVELQPGQGLFLAANEPHAYLSGNCVECMANSDNVVRAGLTGKLKDVDTLSTMLTYQCSHPIKSGLLYDFPLSELKSGVTPYIPPVSDFRVFRVIAVDDSVTFTPCGASILLVISGCGKVVNMDAKDDECREFQMKTGDIALAASKNLTFQNREGSVFIVFIAEPNPQ